MREVTYRREGFDGTMLDAFGPDDVEYVYVSEFDSVIPQHFRMAILDAMRDILDWASFKSLETITDDYARAEGYLDDEVRAWAQDHYDFKVRERESGHICEGPEQIEIQDFAIFDGPNQWGDDGWIRFTYNARKSIADYGLNSATGKASCYAN